MKKFTKYLIEKTNKKEFEIALKNKHINAGCEFEFILDEENRKGISVDIDYIDILIKKSDKEINDINKDITDYQQAVSDKEDEQKELEAKLDSFEDEKTDIEQIISDLEIDAMGESDGVVDKINSNIDGHQKDIDKIENEILDLEEEIRYIDSGEFREELEQQFTLYPSMDNLPHFSKLVEKLEEYGLYDEKTDDEMDGILFNMIEYGETIGDTDYLFNKIFEFYINDFLYDLENPDGGEIDDDYIENDLEFPYPMNNGWEAKPDGSLDEGGVEIVTGIEQVGDLVHIIDEVFDWIDTKGYTNSSCGFHVHMSMDIKHEIDPLKLLMFVEEGKIYKEFEERIGNSYAISMTKGHFDKLEPFTHDNIKSLAKKEKIDKKMNTEKFLGIHLIDLQKNHVEFRYMGGKDYHKKFNAVKEVITNYAHWISIACDPEYKKNEYLTKVIRLTNYYNYLYLFHYLKTFRRIALNFPKLELNVSLVKWNKLLEIELKPYRQSLKSLPKPKIGSKKTSTSIQDLAFKKSTEDFKEFLKKKYGFTKKFVITPF